MQVVCNPEFGEAIRCKPMKIKQEAKKNKTSYLLYLAVYSSLSHKGLIFFYTQPA